MAIATKSVEDGMVVSTKERPLWHNVRKWPCQLPYTKGTVKVPPGYYVLGKVFAQCAQPPYGTSNRSILSVSVGTAVPRSKVLDPMGLLRSREDHAEDRAAELASGQEEHFQGRTSEGWKEYFSGATDEQIISDYESAPLLRKIARFVGLKTKKESTIEQVISNLRAWAK